MSQPRETCVAMEERFLLTTTPGSGERQDQTSNHGRTPTEESVQCCCQDQYHRRLAICSTICGISCIGVRAVIHSVKAEHDADPENAAKSLQKAKKFSIVSILSSVALLVLVIVAVVVISYLVTFQD